MRLTGYNIFNTSWSGRCYPFLLLLNYGLVCFALALIVSAQFMFLWFYVRNLCRLYFHWYPLKTSSAPSSSYTVWNENGVHSSFSWSEGMGSGDDDDDGRKSVGRSHLYTPNRRMHSSAETDAPEQAEAVVEGSVSLVYVLFCLVGSVGLCLSVYVNLFKTVFTCPGYVPHQVWRYPPRMLSAGALPLPPLRTPSSSSSPAPDSPYFSPYAATEEEEEEKTDEAKEMKKDCRGRLHSYPSSSPVVCRHGLPSAGAKRKDLLEREGEREADAHETSPEGREEDDDGAEKKTEGEEAPHERRLLPTSPSPLHASAGVYTGTVLSHSDRPNGPPLPLTCRFSFPVVLATTAPSPSPIRTTTPTATAAPPPPMASSSVPVATPFTLASPVMGTPATRTGQKRMTPHTQKPAAMQSLLEEVDRVDADDTEDSSERGGGGNSGHHGRWGWSNALPSPYQNTFYTSRHPPPPPPPQLEEEEEEEEEEEATQGGMEVLPIDAEEEGRPRAFGASPRKGSRRGSKGNGRNRVQSFYATPLADGSRIAEGVVVAMRYASVEEEEDDDDEKKKMQEEEMAPRSETPPPGPLLVASLLPVAMTPAAQPFSIDLETPKKPTPVVWMPHDDLTRLSPSPKKDEEEKRRCCRGSGRGGGGQCTPSLSSLLSLPSSSSSSSPLPPASSLPMPHAVAEMEFLRANPYTVHLTAEGLVRYCHYCDQYKPDRAFHCRRCRRCVFFMDHHCPFVNNCVGRDNTKYFLLFTLSIPLAAAHMAGTMLYSALFRPAQHLSFVSWYASDDDPTHGGGGGGAVGKDMTTVATSFVASVGSLLSPLVRVGQGNGWNPTTMTTSPPLLPHTTTRAGDAVFSLSNRSTTGAYPPSTQGGGECPGVSSSSLSSSTPTSFSWSSSSHAYWCWYWSAVVLYLCCVILFGSFTMHFWCLLWWRGESSMTTMIASRARSAARKEKKTTMPTPKKQKKWSGREGRRRGQEKRSEDSIWRAEEENEEEEEEHQEGEAMGYAATTTATVPSVVEASALSQWRRWKETLFSLSVFPSRVLRRVFLFSDAGEAYCAAPAAPPISPSSSSFSSVPHMTEEASSAFPTATTIILTHPPPHSTALDWLESYEAVLGRDRRWWALLLPFAPDRHLSLFMDKREYPLSLRDPDVLAGEREEEETLEEEELEEFLSQKIVVGECKEL